ncbi:HD domain-containing protein [Ilumatobacter nonamiensis]|uniref:HD domain-containing protein n=1 Tax=Ilumatobacter nonamiensis TaxID=467093 RepID=UPI0003483277|nr:HD domain-containing protein [Ilumatobacter nonamiensis]
MTAPGTPRPVVSFTAMEHGTRADYQLLDGYEREHAEGLADRLLASLVRLDDSLVGYQVTRLEHSLQTATRARRDGADVDWVVAALLHDLGDGLAPFNHDEFAAAVLRPYVREEVVWVVRHHGLFQRYYFAHHLGGDRDERDRFADHPWFDLCARFCADWDQSSFDPDYSSDDLESFTGDVRQVFAREPWSADFTQPANS